MKLLINTAGIRFGGAVQVALSFIHECKNFPENHYYVFVGRGVRGSLKRENFPANFHFYDFDIGQIKVFNIPFYARLLSKYENKIKPDCVFTTSGPSYWHTKSTHLIGYNLGLYIYPDSPYMSTLSFYRKMRLEIKRNLHFWFFRRDASAYIVQTEDVNHRVRKALGSEKVYTVSNTCNNFYYNPLFVDNKLPPKAPGEIRLLTLSSYYRHKNLEIITALSDELKRRGHNNIKFILTIDQKSFSTVFGKKYNNDVINLGPVKPEACPSLYNECDIMFLPSLAECFSASYPEAMIMQRPIITTDLSFARDICDNAALYFDPMNPVAAADAVEILINDTNLFEKLVERGLKRLKHFNTATERAKRILEICGDLISEQNSEYK